VSFNRFEYSQFSFGKVLIDLGNHFTVNGDRVDWQELSSNFKTNFDQDFAENKAEIT